MTDISRRALMGAGAFGIALAPFASAGAASAAVATNLYTRSRFRLLRTHKFTMANTTTTWPVTLTQITDLPPAAKGDNYRFGLTFHCAVAGPPQGTYLFRRSGFTTTTLFVVPSDSSCRTYQAIINRADEVPPRARIPRPRTTTSAPTS
ncbi:MAG: hypothetical protein QOG98_681 [Pseudonocardiales bacterium]|nr:hypothetical protein [Pseudonocardiales bacterium]